MAGRGGGVSSNGGKRELLGFCGGDVTGEALGALQVTPSTSYDRSSCSVSSVRHLYNCVTEASVSSLTTEDGVVTVGLSSLSLLSVSPHSCVNYDNHGHRQTHRHTSGKERMTSSRQRHSKQKVNCTQKQSQELNYVC